MLRKTDYVSGVDQNCRRSLRTLFNERKLSRFSRAKTLVKLSLIGRMEWNIVDFYLVLARSQPEFYLFIFPFQPNLLFSKVVSHIFITPQFECVAVNSGTTENRGFVLLDVILIKVFRFRDVFRLVKIENTMNSTIVHQFLMAILTCIYTFTRD